MDGLLSDVELEPYIISGAITVQDPDINQSFNFELINIKNTPSDLITITQLEDSNRAVLNVISKIDRENSQINDLGGVLWYNVIVSDYANNSNMIEVSKDFYKFTRKIHFLGKQKIQYSLERSISFSSRNLKKRGNK